MEGFEERTHNGKTYHLVWADVGIPSPMYAKGVILCVTEDKYIWEYVGGPTDTAEDAKLNVRTEFEREAPGFGRALTSAPEPRAVQRRLCRARVASFLRPYGLQSISAYLM